MRPFCIATIGTILGIIIGLYLNSIALFVLLFIISIFLILINILTHAISEKYIKVIFIFLICFFSFWGYTSFLESNYKTINKKYDNQEIEIKAIVVSDKVKKEYKDVYQIQVIGANIKSNVEETVEKQNTIKNQEKSKTESKNNGENKKAESFKMLLNLKRDKNSKLDLKYGDEISFTATYETPNTARNNGGFDYQQYLKTKNITGIVSVKAGEVNVIGKNKASIISKVIHDIRNSAVQKVKQTLPEDAANLCTGLLLGEKTDLSENIQENFRKSNLSHMLAISGAHVSYILLGITTFVQKLKFHKRWSKIFIIIFLLFFMALVGFTPSVTRACIMAILQLLASILFKKSDTYQNLAISSFIILAINPYSLLDIGFQLSFGGTIGIIIFSRRLLKGERTKIMKVIKEMCIVTMSANVLIIPIMMYHFNTISFTFLISNLLASPILGIALISSMIFLILLFIFLPIAKIMSFLLQPILQLLIWIAEISSKLPLSQVLVRTPAIWQIILYYVILSLIYLKANLLKRANRVNDIIEVKETKLAACTNQNSQNVKSTEIIKSKQFQIQKYEKYILILLIIFLISPYLLTIFPQNKLTINFIDVGQGDSMLIQTPSRKTILIDGGGSETGSFDVGEKTLLPYLLDKGILKIDYMMFSHFDSDHCQGLFTIMEKLKVKNAIISKQGEESANYSYFLNLAKRRKVKIITVQVGDFIQIDKQCFISILFPEQDLISSNVLNNNSIVAKFTYRFSSTKTDSRGTSYSKDKRQSKEFTMLLTGDIEEIAEKRLVEKYKNTNDMQAIILKVAHHRF